MITQRTEAELKAYLQSDEFKQRAAELRPRVIANAGTADEITFEEMAEVLDLPFDVVIGGFMHSMEKAGMPVRPVGIAPKRTVQ